MKTETKKYPVLTLEKLSLLERRVRNYNITREDLDLIDHYVSSASGGEERIKRVCLELGILSIEEALEVIQYRENNFKDGYAAAGLAGSLKGMINFLKREVSAGEEIY